MQLCVPNGVSCVTAGRSEDNSSILPCGRTLMHASTLLFQVSKLGSGNYGITMLLRKRATGELVAGKFIERGGMVRHFSVIVMFEFHT